MKRPFIHLVVPFMLGIYICNKIEINVSLSAFMILIVIIMKIIYIIFLKRRNYIFLWILFLLLGNMAGYNHLNKSELDRFSDEKVSLKGVVKNEVVKSKGYEKYVIEVSNITYKNKHYNVKEKLILTIYDNSDIRLGDNILVRDKIKVPKENTNPMLFNYKLYLQSNDIFTIMSTNKYSVNIIKRNNLSKGERISQKFKKKISFILDKNLDTENSSIIKSIILGDSTYLDENTQNKFRNLGIAHVLAVSGLHIGIIFAFILYILNFLKVHRKIASILAIILILIYGYIIGYPPSVVRSSVMFSLLIVSTITYRRYDSINILALSAFIMLIYKPLWLFNMGFQLSYVATLSILLFNSKVKKIFSNKFRFLADILSPIISVYIGMLPISLYYFNSLQIISILSNLVLVPLLSLSLIISFIMIITYLMSSIVSNVIGYFINILLVIFTKSMNLVHNLSYNIIVHSPNFIEMIMYYVLICIALNIIKTDFLNRKFIRIINYYLILIIFIVSTNYLIEEYAIIDFIDVGQGDSCIVRLKDKNILIDTGGSILNNFDVGKNIVLPYLQKNGINSLDGVFISHFHEDHAEGLLSLIGNIKIKNIFIGYKSQNNKLYRDIIKLSSKHNIPIRLIKKDDKIILNKNSAIDILSPERKEDVNFKNENNMSLVFILKTYNKSLLFTGDIEKEKEKDIVKINYKHKVDIIKIPHHGSKTSSTEEFIKRFEPRYGIIQVGKNNFGHPNKEVLENYEKHEIKLYRNDTMGLITVLISENDFKIENYLKSKPVLEDVLKSYILDLGIISMYMIIWIVMIYNYKLSDLDKINIDDEVLI
ncbi:DNA internalization-like competence protein ComEC/Rec2 [Gottschalkia purinilytica]|uniref:DNA internalization-like competence protein ComEC/Rec2 n=1 Tax=Gottschalkia purinilytica TaxID=1503 RepID=A0A0L0WD66_GOTPU|nr:DNA internalization-related competence protein ComEC/Rec2 [Gottschalkia purinilytica]KNF09370.1 DNA internalization-like competence protein ComEC/Rec2 [Gottschalkia purinilytica]